MKIELLREINVYGNSMLSLVPTSCKFCYFFHGFHFLIVPSPDAVKNFYLFSGKLAEEPVVLEDDRNDHLRLASNIFLGENPLDSRPGLPQHSRQEISVEDFNIAMLVV